MSDRLSQVRAIAGSKGGRSTVKRHGRQHMSRIGKRGAQSMHTTYRLEPVFLNDFAIVHRITGEVKNYLSGKKPEGAQP